MTAENEDQYENNLLNNPPELCEENYEREETVLQLNESTLSSIPDELISEMALLTMSDEFNSSNTLNDLSPCFEKAAEEIDFSEKLVSDLSLNENADSITNQADSVTPQINKQYDADSTMHQKVPQSPESLLNSLITNVRFDSSDKERAVKILLHTRNFRE